MLDQERSAQAGGNNQPPLYSFAGTGQIRTDTYRLRLTPGAASVGYGCLTDAVPMKPPSIEAESGRRNVPPGAVDGARQLPKSDEVTARPPDRGR